MKGEECCFVVLLLATGQWVEFCFVEGNPQEARSCWHLCDCLCHCFCGNLVFGVPNHSCGIARQPFFIWKAFPKDCVTNLSRKHVLFLINLTYRLSMVYRLLSGF